MIRIRAHPRRDIEERAPQGRDQDDDDDGAFTLAKREITDSRSHRRIRARANIINEREKEEENARAVSRFARSTPRSVARKRIHSSRACKSARRLPRKIA